MAHRCSQWDEMQRRSTRCRALLRRKAAPPRRSRPTSLPRARPHELSRRRSTRLAGITTLVNAAGIIGSGSVESTDDDQWDRMMDINMPRALPADARGDACARHVTRKRGERVERDRPARVPRRARVLREQGGGRSIDAMRRAGDGRKGRARQRRESWRRDLQSAPPRRHVRGELCGVHPTVARNASARTSG